MPAVTSTSAIGVATYNHRRNPPLRDVTPGGGDAPTGEADGRTTSGTAFSAAPAAATASSCALCRRCSTSASLSSATMDSADLGADIPGALGIQMTVGSVLNRPSTRLATRTTGFRTATATASASTGIVPR